MLELLEAMFHLAQAQPELGEPSRLEQWMAERRQLFTALQLAVTQSPTPSSPEAEQLVVQILRLDAAGQHRLQEEMGKLADQLAVVRGIRRFHPAPAPGACIDQRG